MKVGANNRAKIRWRKKSLELTRPRLSPISELLAVPSDELAAGSLATASSAAAARFRLIKVTVYVSLECGLRQKKKKTRNTRNADRH